MAANATPKPLLTAVEVGGLKLQHRVTMSAMTRLRCDPVTEAPREINALYYAQRTSQGGLIVTEGTAPSAVGRGYVRAPNLYEELHVEAWRKVTSRVHELGGVIFAQLMHAGRVSHSSINGQLPLAPSAVKMAGMVHTKTGKLPYEEPKAMTIEDIAQAVKDHATAAKNAVSAGFDGIEIHGGNGYLIQEFCALKTNLRTDEYGGTVENRCRFLLEVVDACCAAIGSDKVAIKIQPGVTFSDLVEPEEDVLAQLNYLGPELSKRGLAYVDCSSLNGDPYYKFARLAEPNVKTDVWRYFRKCFTGTLMINGGLSVEQGEEYVADGTADLVSFGVLYVANANLPALINAGKPLNYGGADMSVWYSRDPANDAKGYTDWPLVEA